MERVRAELAIDLAYESAALAHTAVASPHAVARNEFDLCVRVIDHPVVVYFQL